MASRPTGIPAASPKNSSGLVGEVWGHNVSFIYMDCQQSKNPTLNLGLLDFQETNIRVGSLDFREKSRNQDSQIQTKIIEKRDKCEVSSMRYWPRRPFGWVFHWSRKEHQKKQHFFVSFDWVFFLNNGQKTCFLCCNLCFFGASKEPTPELDCWIYQTNKPALVLAVSL